MHLGKRFVVVILLWVFIVLIGYTPIDNTSLKPAYDVVLEQKSGENKEVVLPGGISNRYASGSIEVSGSIFGLKNGDEIAYLLRNTIISGLMREGFEGRNIAPYSGSNANGVITYQGTGYTVWQGISKQDSLDERITELADIQYNEEFQDIFTDDSLRVGSGIWSDREDIYLFKNQKDLESLGYEVVSSRRRISTDQEYRRKNIAQSFNKIGHIRVIPPSGDLVFMDAAQYDGVTRENYEYGYVVIGNQEKLDYGGGICGASSAIYQGIVSNGSLQTPGVRNHTRWYGYLYDAYIDGELVTTPGIDSAVFDGSLDLEMVNTASHPIVIIMNYDGTLGGVEEVFTLGMPTDKQQIEFLSSYPVTYTGPSGVGTGEVTMRGGCYTWMIGDEKVKRCYRKVSQ